MHGTISALWVPIGFGLVTFFYYLVKGWHEDEKSKLQDTIDLLELRILELTYEKRNN